MNASGSTPRRGFLARLAGAAAALTAGVTFPPSATAVQRPAHDRWLTGLTGRHRTLFDFPQHGDGLPQIHIFNYINTYRPRRGAGLEREHRRHV